MAIVFDGPVAPVDLTTLIRTVPVSPLNRLTALFPTKFVQTNTIDFAEIVRTNRTAKYRAWDGRISVSSRDSGSEKRVKLAPLSTSLSQGEYETLQLLFAQTQGQNIQALVDSIYNDAVNLTNEVHNRIELAWGDVLTDGKLTINENGFQDEADYGVPGTHIANAATVWSNTAAATPITDIRALCEAYRTTNGFYPASLQTSQAQLLNITLNTQIINAIKGSAAGVTMVTIADVNQLLQSLGLPPFRDPYDAVLDVDGSSVRPLAADKVLFLPPNLGDLGQTVFGVTATALKLVQSPGVSFSFQQSPGIVGVIEEVGPPYRKFTYVDACGMPVLYNAKLLAVLDVI